MAVAAVAALLFLLLYGWPGKVQERTMAWHIATVTAVAALEAGALLAALWGVRLPVLIYTLVYGASAAVLVWRLLLLVQIRRVELDIKAWLYAGLRTFAQALWTLLVAYLAKRGIALPEFLHGWFVDVVITATAIGAVTSGIRWLETRKGDSFGARLARRAAAVIMLGLSAKQPVYAPADTRATPVEVTSANGQTVPTLRE